MGNVQWWVVPNACTTTVTIEIKPATTKIQRGEL
jgi:hypothetical protein